MLEELGISFGTALIILIAMYFIIKWAVKNAIEESSLEISKAVKKGIEKYYENRLSQKLIQYAIDYLKMIGFNKVHIVSDHENLYEKFEVRR